MRQIAFVTLTAVVLTAGCKEPTSSRSPKAQPSAEPGEVVLNVPGMH
jgi:hypothetical protein